MNTAFVGVSLLAIASGQTMINRQVDRIASKLTPTGGAFIAGQAIYHSIFLQLTHL